MSQTANTGQKIIDERKLPRKRMEQNGSSLNLILEGSRHLPVDISKVVAKKLNFKNRAGL